MKKFFSAVLAALCVCGARAEVRNASTAAELYDALQALNGTGGEILLAPGNYDVSAYLMVPTYEANTVTNDMPGFVKGNGRDYYALKYFSPARGKGLVQDWMADATDIREDPAFPRLREGLVDIGCYQCWLDPVGLWFSIR